MKYIFTLLFAIITFQISAQNVSVISEGTGNTKETATLNALENALMETYGTFISSKTTMKDFKLTSDEIVSVCQGNIVNYREVSYFPDSSNMVILDVTVSTDNFVSYINNRHGSSVTINASAFCSDYAIKQFNKEKIKKVLTHFVYKLDEIAHDMYNYNITVSAPTIKGKDVFMDITVNATPNEHLDYFLQELHKTWKAIQPYMHECDNSTVARFKDLLYGIYRWNCYNFVIADNLGNQITTVIEKNTLLPNENTVYCERTAGGNSIYLMSNGVEIFRSLRDPILFYNIGAKAGVMTFKIKYSLEDFKTVRKISVYPC